MNLEKIETATSDECFIEISVTEKEQKSMGLIEIFKSLAETSAAVDEESNVEQVEAIEP